MTTYKHTQVGYLMLFVTLAVLVLFTWLQVVARIESPSPDSGTNFAMTATMILIVLVLASFGTLTVSIDGLASGERTAQSEQFLKVRFGWGLFRRQFSLNDIASVKKVKNHWYYGWGIRLWLWPKMWIYNVSGFEAVELVLKNGKVYRIGTDEPEVLEQALNNHLR